MERTAAMPLPDGTLLRVATADDIEAMRDVERDAGRRFLGFPADTGLHEIAADDPPEAEVLAAHIDNDAAWVVTDAGEVVAYAVASMIDDDAHLDQVSVRMSHQGRGIGTILVEVVCDWASSLDFEAVSLTTFRDVPFNGPFYAARGFVEVDEDRCGDELRSLRDHERYLGLDVQPRIVMRRTLA
ncbi:MAG: GNAT family N-acetyltransferase [Acidimicrobiales bacterium]|nr:GNAT family N-acetyltransferase [Acidimicrobiales bacterium]MCB9396101.1 GNAT family N-acetyltransferase [Acidimicrobiaceae bacterium]